MKTILALFITAIALGSPRSFAAAKWWCSATILAEGNAHYFLLYGRDAWEGEDELNCTSLSGTVRQPVRLGFYSKNTGFGANGTSNVSFTITFWTDKEPKNIKFFTTVPGLLDGSMVHWQASDSGLDLTASAWTQSSPAVADSLSLGTFDLRAIETRK